MSNRRSVLVVEDSLPTQAALKELLETAGWQVVAVAAGETQATEWLQSHPRAWDLVLLDLLLQEGSGFGLIQRCRAEHPAGRIAVFSEYASPALKEKCLGLGADAVFLKSELPDLLVWLENLERQ